MVINKKRSLIAGGLTFIFLLGITSYILYNQYSFYGELQHKAVQNATLSAKTNLENVLNKGACIAKTMGFIVENYGLPDNFDSLAVKLMKNDTSILAIQLLEKGVITKVFPYSRNKSIIGYNILNDSTRNEEAFIAIRKKSFYFAGPFTLKQGGFGIVGRMPLYRGSAFIGFSAVVIKFDNLIKSANIHNSDAHFMEYQLVKISPYNGKKELFISGDPDFEQSNSAKTEIPLGGWTLIVKPKKLITVGVLKYTAFFGLIISVIGGLFIGYLFYIPEKLKWMVHKRTLMLQKNETKLTKSISQIMEQNNRLREMSWTQSHMVRAPLARLLGLTYLLKLSENLPEKEREMVNHIQSSAEEFDAMIKNSGYKRNT